MYSFIKSFLQGRQICVKVGNSYSSCESTDMGIPQGAIISPLLFNILLYDLPKHVSNKVTLVQYADDIAMWTNVSLRKKTSLSVIKHVQKVYQSEIDNLKDFMKQTGLEFSIEKTNSNNKMSEPQILL